MVLLLPLGNGGPKKSKMWMYGPSIKEKSKKLHGFNEYPVHSLPFKIADPPLQGQKKFFKSMPCGYSKLMSQDA